MQNWLSRYWTVVLSTPVAAFGIAVLCLLKFPAYLEKLGVADPKELNVLLLVTVLTVAIVILLNVSAMLDRQGRSDAALAKLRAELTSKGTHFCERVDTNQFYNHLSEAIENATASVDLTNLDIEPPDHFRIPEMERYFSALANLVHNKPRIHFRRIVSITTREKLKWVRDMLLEVGKYPNISIRVIPDFTSALPPPLSMQIVDRRKVLIVDPSTALIRPQSTNNLWIEGGEVSECFGAYYEKLWDSGERIKDGTKVDLDLIAQIERKLSQPNAA